MLVVFILALLVGSESTKNLFDDPELQKRVHLKNALRREDEFMANHLRDEGWIVKDPNTET